MMFGDTGSPIDGAHWLVMTQGLLLLVVLLPVLAVLAVLATRSSRRRTPTLAPQRQEAPLSRAGRGRARGRAPYGPSR